MIAIDRFDHVVITTKDVDASVQFYTDALGLTLDRTNNRYALKCGNQKINLHRGKAEFLPAARNVTIGGVNICLGTDGAIRPIMDRLEQNNIPIIEGVSYRRLGARGTMDSVYVRDPDNNLVEIGANGTCPDAPITTIDHLVLDVADLAASTAFYTELLHMAGTNAGTACTVAFGAGKINLHMGEPHFAPARENVAPGSGDFCLIATGDIAAIHAELVARNAPLEPEMSIVRRTGATGPIDSIYLRDPDGNLVEISTPAAG